MKRAIFSMLVLLVLAACAPPIEQSISAETDATADEQTFLPIVLNDSDGSVTPTTDIDWTDAWILNTTDATSNVFPGIKTDVTSVYTKTVSGVDYQCMTASGIPSYVTTVDQNDLDRLNNRPLANEFNGLATSPLALGDVIEFGESVGYTPSMGCTSTEDGYGYWPLGPSCPTDQEKDWCFPLDPQPTTEVDMCESGLGASGVWVNGVSIFNWLDGMSYNNDGVWENDALHLEGYDLDICVGHSANGDYHHHSAPDCLQEALSDTGTEASPIYGFSADGYPVYGPWESAGVLAQSCWKTRDYSAGSPTGCGVDGERSCLLVNQYDISEGTVDASSSGPATTDQVTSASGNPIDAVSGAYFQDYYYDSDCTDQGVQYLDEHNAHDVDGIGYHYHVTLTDAGNGDYDYAFPHYNGITYAGELDDEGIVTSCSTDDGGGGPGGGGPPGGGPPGGG